MEQGTNYLPYIITGIVMMIVGWTMGFFDSNMRSEKKIKQAESSANTAIEEAKKKAAQAEAQLASTPATPILVDDPGIFRIKNENGAIALDLDGNRVDTSAISTEQRKRLVEMVTIMRPWLEGKPVSTPASAVASPAPLPQSAAAPSQPPLPPIVPQPTAPPAIIAKEDRPAAPAGSIVNQIDSILQSRLIGSPLENRGVFLAQSPDGGVMVYVGLTKYMSVDEVPEDEIKSAIRAAITEWENKFTPGLK